MKHGSQLGIDWRTIYQLAAEADVSHNTVLRALRGREISGAAGRRLSAVIQVHAQANDLPIRTAVKPTKKRTA